MFDSFLTRAALAGLGVALAAGPLGCFVVWRRMAYFGDATAHAAILGVALSLGFAMPVFAGTLAVALVMAFIVSSLGDRGHSSDTALGVLSHSALAFGLLAAAAIPTVRIDLIAYLQGDILTVGRSDLVVIWIGAALVVALLVWRWEALLISTLSPDLAIASGIDPRRESRVLTLALAVIVALSIKVVGVLLIAALLIIPAASARRFAETPERMAIVSTLLAAMAALLGFAISVIADTPAGPTIISVAALIFAGSMLTRR